ALTTRAAQRAASCGPSLSQRLKPKRASDDRPAHSATHHRRNRDRGRLPAVPVGSGVGALAMVTAEPQTDRLVLVMRSAHNAVELSVLALRLLITLMFGLGLLTGYLV